MPFRGIMHFGSGIQVYPAFPTPIPPPRLIKFTINKIITSTTKVDKFHVNILMVFSIIHSFIHSNVAICLISYAYNPFLINFDFFIINIMKTKIFFCLI